MGRPGRLEGRRLPIPLQRRQMVDWLELGQRHPMHALIELDVTDARDAIRRRRAMTGRPLSLTAYLVACFARSIGEDPRVQAMPDGRGHLVEFDDVDVTVMVEQDAGGESVALPSIVRRAQSKDAAAIDREIHAARSDRSLLELGQRWLPLWLVVPDFYRRFLLRRLLADPWRRRRLTGTTIVTSVGMFGSGSGWAISPPGYPVGLTIGGLARKPGLARAGSDEERVVPRELLSVTVSLDHDVVDGAPAARFIRRFRERVERAEDF